MDVCIFCKEPLATQPTTTLTTKGCEGIEQANVLRNTDIHTIPGQIVHTNCRKTFCAPNSIKKANKKRDIDSSASESGPSTRCSTGAPFRYKDNCLFCGQPDKYGGKKELFKLVPVRTMAFQCNIKSVCDTRDDSWAETVRARLEFAQDLPAADAVYHNMCSTNFRTGKQIPSQFLPEDGCPSKRQRKGRPLDSVKADAFLKVAAYLESHDEEQTTVQELITKMQEYLPPDVEAFGFTYMKAKIQEHFGDSIIITEINGKPNVVTFKHTVSSILYDFYHQPKKNDDQAEKIRIIQTAARLITSDVKSVMQANDTYPDFGEMSSSEQALSFIPVSLQILLNMLFVGKKTDKKVASLGQAIMQAIRPRVLIAPLQLGLAVQLHHHFGSRFLIEALNGHGFCSPYHEVQKFERSAAVAKGIDIANFTADSTIQYMADNVDHNISTLDGLNTFHGMGMLATVTPAKKVVRLIPRISVSAAEVAAVGRINIHHLTTPCTGLQSLKYEALRFQQQNEPKSYDGLDTLWTISLHLRPVRPAWSGMMQTVHKGTHPGPASVLFLPMIDLDPTNLSCIYSTLKFVRDHARRYGIKTPMLTFDQPLWWKALTIIESEPENSDLRDFVVRLGGFHTLMSFLGCIGHIMAGSGLEQLLEQAYAKNTVSHMLSGKAYARAVRGHLLVDAALNTLLTAMAFNIPSPSESGSRQPHIDDDENDGMSGMSGWSADNEGKVALANPETDPQASSSIEMGAHQSDGQRTEDTDGRNVIHPDLQQAATLYDDLMDGKISVSDVQSSDILQRLAARIQQTKDSFKGFHTAELWIQYIDMIGIMRRFLMSERTGNWQLHLQVLQEMLPYLAAAGHSSYTKSIHMYLQHIAKQLEKHPELQTYFQEGLHVVRRSDRYWAGLSTDLVIEQILMRSLKTTGGLTRGRGMEETQRLTWLLSRPVCAEVNHAMQEFTCTNFQTSEQHKDMSSARQERDISDTNKFMSFLSSKNPFSGDASLHNIDSGVCAPNNANPDRSQSVGKTFLDKMLDQPVLDYVFRKKDQIITMEAKSEVKVGTNTLSIDSQLLFQRLVVAGKNSGDLEKVFKYELCSYPPAMFESAHVLLEATKPALADAIWKQISEVQQVPPDDVQFVLDGGALLQRVPWKTGEPYASICGLYLKYIERRFGHPTVVFDGYGSGPTTKDGAHTRRAKHGIGLEVHFTKDMVCTLKKEQFLSNTANKQRFIDLLSSHLQQHGCKVLHAKADADVLMVKTAITMAADHDVALVGDDTDLLILLCSQAPATPFRIFFRPEPKLNVKKLPRCWDINAVQRSLGKTVCDNILFVHAILGCDTTSRLFGIGKPMALKKIQSSEYFQQQAAVFQRPGASKNEIITAGENALVCLYNGQPGECIDGLRLQRFHQKVCSSSTYVQPQNLPPTAAAAKYHSMRVYHQVQQWIGVNLPAEDWGWTLCADKLLPIHTDLKPAPAYLLEAIHCGCKCGCNTQQCGCRKYGLECSPACVECKGIHCSNVTLLDGDCDMEDVR